MLTVTGTAGCLLIVKHCTGDRLNFGLAAELARAFCQRVEMVIVDDDIALPDLPRARGVVGTLFVHKIVGAMAEEGADLETIAAVAQRAVDGVASIGMPLDTCILPGAPKQDRSAAGRAEFGLGIQGEAGVDKVTYEGARHAMELKRLVLSIGHRPHAALINTPGSAIGLEMSIFAAEVIRSRMFDCIEWLIGHPPVMPSVDMKGFWASLLPVGPAEEAES